MAREDSRRPRAPGPNDPCPCGSGRKWKRCHGLRAVSASGPGAGAAAEIAAETAIAERLMASGRADEAQDAYVSILAREPRNFAALLAMAQLAQRAGDDDASLHYHTRLAESHPDDARAQFACGNFHARRYDFPRARACYRKAVELAPAWSGAWNNLGNVEKYLGNLPEGLACYDRAVAADPDNAALHSSALIALHYDTSTSHDDLLARHVAWADRHAARHYPPARAWPNAKEPERILRIGYLSAWFDGHILAHFLRHVLPHHDRARFSIYAYSGTRQPDDYTTELAGTVDHWRDVRALSDDAVAGSITTDAIDVLVDLDGHTPGSRLLVLARKPAPVQVTWLGYFNTTGIRAIDYIVTDPRTTPADSPQRFAETPLRLPETRFCYAPVRYAPDVSPAPCARRGVFTFGSFNRYDKIGPDVVACWSEVLSRVPAARLVIKNSAMAIPYARTELARQFADRGIAPGRVELRGKSPHPAMLEEYGDIDLGLDTFPYNGGLTTCEALWQGVPIVAIAEERMISRQTAAMLQLVGAGEFVARTRDEYVALAVGWAQRPADLALVRQELRGRMRASPLCDGPRFTRDLETALRNAWRAWCA
jgi:protein O-GlcNAc transferase